MMTATTLQYHFDPAKVAEHLRNLGYDVRYNPNGRRSEYIFLMDGNNEAVEINVYSYMLQVSRVDSTREGHEIRASATGNDAKLWEKLVPRVKYAMRTYQANKDKEERIAQEYARKKAELVVKLKEVLGEDFEIVPTKSTEDSGVYVSRGDQRFYIDPRDLVRGTKLEISIPLKSLAKTVDFLVNEKILYNDDSDLFDEDTE